MEGMELKTTHYVATRVLGHSIVPLQAMNINAVNPCEELDNAAAIVKWLREGLDFEISLPSKWEPSTYRYGWNQGARST